MLKPGWYLPDTDWFTQLPDAPKLGKDGQAVIARLADLLSHRFPGDPARTVAATHVALLAADYLGDTMRHHTRCHDLTEVARLICGLNLMQAHLTQTIQRIASNAYARAYPGVADVPAELLGAVTDSLSIAGVNSELLAAHLKEAHLLLRRLEQ
ncbi:hypothetical protein [Paractinoplanes hotanensis]|uniref:Uncharacterized protein n=1 Tax=Paractinoplanes hotanensis TaxID=2906497 RepID=A0ABT0XWY5_9ACTN|nr:hypothetical protein [Actinoplanes hotanensis]MCM4078279.1 hypothetical protein [Actinoplanes hotanensis]